MGFNSGFKGLRVTQE